MGRIPPETIERIKSENDIVEVISEYIPLKKAGKNYKSLCPFHQEKTPSFYVSPEYQMYHCFGCGARGNVISFVMEYEKMDFIDAVKLLAERAGISIKFQGTDIQERIIQLNTLAAEIAHNLLYSDIGKEALKYLMERGIKDDVIKEFSLGYSPDEEKFLLNKVIKDFTMSEIIKSGLVVKYGTGYRDRFRGRIIFPIFSHSGNIVGFGGRTLKGDSAKYLNSPETPVYNKRNVLYGFFQAKGEIRKLQEVILVEGYFDFLTMYSGGFKNSVASLGTSLTEHQAEILSHYVKSAYVMYDADEAGIKAAMRGATLLFENGVDVRIVSVSQGKDPDEMLRNEGKEYVVDILKKSIPFIDAVIEKNKGDENIFNREKTAKQFQEMISHIKDPVRKEIYADEIGKRLSVNPIILSGNLEEKKTKEKPRSIKAFNLELALILLLIQDNKLFSYVDGKISTEDVEHPVVKKILRKMYSGIFPKREDFFSEIDENAINPVVERLFNENDSASFLQGIVKKIKKNVINRKIKEIQGEIINKEKNGDDITQYLKEEESLLMEKRDL